MDIVDREVEKAERDASPERFPRNKNMEWPHVRASTSSSISATSATSSSESVTREEIRTRMSRENTMADLDRHPTTLSRIETIRSQHTGTVGRSLRSRSQRSKPLPGFGAGKPYPPPLPAQEEYVVEFDGHDDLLHPQNWPMRKKSVTRFDFL